MATKKSSRSTMRRVAASTGAARFATCPFNIPVVSLPPHQMGGFSWGHVIRPMGDACVARIAVEPTNDSAWYVGGQHGLYMTKNSGQTWTHPLSGQVGVLLLVPGSTQLVYVGIANKLYLSRDKGQTWNVIGEFKHSIHAVLVASSRLYVDLAGLHTLSRAASSSRTWVAAVRRSTRSAPGKLGLSYGRSRAILRMGRSTRALRSSIIRSPITHHSFDQLTTGSLGRT